MVTIPIKKKLFTCYEVKIKKNTDLEQIRKDHHFWSCSNGVATCKTYYESFDEWFKVCMDSKFKCGFGMDITSEHGRVSIGLRDASPWFCRRYDIMPVITEVIKAYFNTPDFAWIIPANPIHKTSFLSGHMYRNSPNESSDSCGNCDGANCDTCRRYYKVYDELSQNTLYYGDSEDCANSVANRFTPDYTNCLTAICEYYGFDINDWLSDDRTIEQSLWNMIHTNHIPAISEN